MCFLSSSSAWLLLAGLIFALNLLPSLPPSFSIKAPPSSCINDNLSAVAPRLNAIDIVGTFLCCVSAVSWSVLTPCLLVGELLSLPSSSEQILPVLRVSETAWAATGSNALTLAVFSVCNEQLCSNLWEVPPDKVVEELEGHCGNDKPPWGESWPVGKLSCPVVSLPWSPFLLQARGLSLSVSLLPILTSPSVLLPSTSGEALSTTLP